jgi:hypothetical protein
MPRHAMQHRAEPNPDGANAPERAARHPIRCIHSPYPALPRLALPCHTRPGLNKSTRRSRDCPTGCFRNSIPSQTLPKQALPCPTRPNPMVQLHREELLAIQPAAFADPYLTMPRHATQHPISPYPTTALEGAARRPIRCFRRPMPNQTLPCQSKPYRTLP